MSKSDVGFLSLIEPTCHIQVGLRTPEQNEACIRAETKLYAAFAFLLTAASFGVGKSTIPDMTYQEDEFGRRRRVVRRNDDGTLPTGHNYRRGAKYATWIAAASALWIFTMRQYRRGVFRAEKMAVLAGTGDRLSAEYINNRIIAEATQNSTAVNAARFANSQQPVITFHQ